MKIYNLFYYYLYEILEGINEGMGRFLAVLALSWICIINCFSLSTLFMLKGFDWAFRIDSLLGIPFVILVYVAHIAYFRSIRNQIVKYFEKNKLNHWIWVPVTITYIFGSLLIYYYFTLKTAAGILE
jgi:hypothetical protein